MQLLRQFTQQLLSVCFENCFDVVSLANTEPDFQYNIFKYIMYAVSSWTNDKEIVMYTVRSVFLFL